VSDTPVVPTPLYGLRTWTVVGETGAERLAGPHQRATWPPAGAWLKATCARSSGHEPPAAGCDCGVHAWHPSRRFARQVLAFRRDVPGIVEARGAIEVHEDGFRAELARPYILFLTPRGNARQLERLAEAYHAEVVEVDGAGAVLAFCRERGLGLNESTVSELLGPLVAEERRRTRRARTRRDGLRLVAVVAVSALLVVIGLEVLKDPPGERVIHGRTGEIHINSR
jgi:hypothetical protein